MHQAAIYCHTVLPRPSLDKNLLNATHRTLCGRVHQRALGSCVAAQQNESAQVANADKCKQRAARVGTRSESLFGALLQSAAAQATEQLQSTFNQVSKLTKGFQPRPDGYPPGPPGDSAADMLLDPLSFLERVSKQYGPVAGLVLGGESVILVTEGAAAQHVLITHAAVYRKEGTAFFPGSSLAGQGLLVTDGAVWQRQRQLTNPAFRRAAVEAYALAMSEATEHMLSSVWASGGTRDVYADYNDLTLSITTNALFGVDMSSSQSAGISNAVRVAFDFFSKRAALGFIVPEWLPTPENAQYHAAVAELDTAVYGIIADRKRRLAQLTSSPQQKPQCLLDNLLLAKDDEGHGLSLQSLRDQLMTLLVAGQETSAILLGWTTAFLAHHPDVQQQAAAEVREVLQGEAPTPENTRKLPYLERVVLESLRLRPPAYMVGRCAAQCDTLAGYNVSPGTTILVSPYVMHRDNKVWQIPQTLNPDRWCQHQEARHSPARDSAPPSSPSESSNDSRDVSSSNASSSTSSQAFANQTPQSSTRAAHNQNHDIDAVGRQPNSSTGSATSEPMAQTSPSTTHSSGNTADMTHSNENGIARSNSSGLDSHAEPRNGTSPGRQSRAGAASILSGMGPNGSYVPFGAGPRNCVGTGFAMMEAMLVLAAGLQKYKFMVDSNAPFPEATPRITLRPASVNIVLSPRL